MKTIKQFLEEQINDQLIQAILSAPRTSGGPSKIKIRPIPLKGDVRYQASATEGTKVFHTNYTRDEVIAFIEEEMQNRFTQLQIQGNKADGTVLVSKKGKITIKTKIKQTPASAPVRILSHNRVKQYSSSIWVL